MRIAIAVVMIVAWSAEVQSAGVSESQDDSVRRELVKLLKDPESARFSALSASEQGDGTTLICGTVNAKNGFGGYGGAMPFTGKLYSDGNFYLTKIAQKESEAPNLYALCKAVGAEILE